MYVPRFNALDDADEIRALVAAVGSAQLVTVGPDGYPLSTLLPVIWDDGRLVFHMARANQHWKAIADGSPALAVVTGPEAYVSPGWYASKAEHGRVVPTWNYSAVQFTGGSGCPDERVAARGGHPADRPPRGSAGTLPGRSPTPRRLIVERQLRAIVGIEMAIERVEGKAKLSQNRSAEDRAGVVEGLRRRRGGRREQQVADAMVGSTDLASTHRGSSLPMRPLGSIHASSPANAGTPAALHSLGHDAAGPPAVRPRVPSSPDRRGRRRGDRRPGAGLLVEPGGSNWFYVATLVLAGVWAVGAFASGPLHLGRVGIDETAAARPIVQPILVGLGLSAVFVAGAFLVKLIPPLADQVGNVLAYANDGNATLVLLVTVVNGIAEEMFFRGALYAAIRKNQVRSRRSPTRSRPPPRAT